jgi:hypothetical protein
MKAAEQDICHGGIMSIKRAVISNLVTLGFAGSVLAGVAVPAVTAVTSTTPVVAAVSATPMVYMHG